MKQCAFFIGAILISILSHAQTHRLKNDSSSKIRLVALPNKPKIKDDFLLLVSINGTKYILNKRAIKKKLIDSSNIAQSYVVRSDELPVKQKNRLPQIIFILKDNIPEHSMRKIKRYIIPTNL